MALALEIVLDDAATDAVHSAWLELAEAGVPSLATHTHCRHEPHVTFTVAMWGLDEELARAALAGTTPPPLTLSGPAAAPGEMGVFYLTVVPTLELLDLQAEVDRRLQAEGADLWPHYRPGSWVPHCMLGMGLADRHWGDALRLARAWPMPLETRAVGASLVDVGTGDSVRIASW